MKTKKIGIDTFRLIAAFLVIANHISPFLNFNKTFDFAITHIFARIAVPFFFLVTGYFVLPKALKDKQILYNYIRKIIMLYIIISMLFSPFIIYNFNGKEMSAIYVLRMIFLDGTFYHLWYLPALALGLGLSYFMIKYIKKPFILVFIFIALYFIGLGGDSYYYFIQQIPLMKNFYAILFEIMGYTRNGFFFAPIFLGMGYYLSKHNMYYSKKIIVGFMISLIALLFEGLMVMHFQLSKHDSMYLCLIPVMYFLFRYLLSNQEKPNAFYRHVSTYVYLLHPLFIIIIRGFAKVTHLKPIIVDQLFIFYILVSVSTLITSIIIYYINEKWKKSKFIYQKTQ